MKPDGRRANHIIVEKLLPNCKETLTISLKLQPNVIYSELVVTSVSTGYPDSRSFASSNLYEGFNKVKR